MYYIEINNRVNQTVEIFQRFGIWRIEDKSFGFSKIAWKLKYLIFQLSFITSLILGGLLSDDKNESVYLLVTGIAVSVATVKLIYILWKAEEIHAFIQYIGIHSITDYENYVKVNDKLKKLIKFSECFVVMALLGTGALSIFSLPVFSSEKRLPFSIWLPLDWKNNAIVYWIAYGYLIVGIINCMAATTFNMIIWYLLMNCGIKYEILGNEFKNVFLTKSTIKNRNISREEEENSFLQEFIRLIKTHRDTKETIHRFKCCFGNLFSCQITTSGACICGSVYALTFGSSDEDLIQSMFFGVILFYNFFDIFMIMYLGNEIVLSSDRLSYCLFESNWVDQSKACKKCIIILTEVFKQPHELVIGILYPLNLETFTAIVNLAYSMFNILKNFN